jgi:hypothetical protein
VWREIKNFINEGKSKTGKHQKNLKIFPSFLFKRKIYKSQEERRKNSFENLMSEKIS